MSGVWQKIGTPEPPTWTSACLLAVNEMLTSGLRKAIRPDALGALLPAEWTLGRKALDRHFGKLDSANHMFGANVLNWGFRLTEPQVTKGWQNFLSPKVIGNELAARRVTVFYKAILAAAKKQPIEISICPGSLYVEAEHKVQADNSSIDLLIQWNDTSAEECRCALVLELKFGHVLTAGQLPTYKTYVEREFIRGENAKQKSGFFVLSPRTRRTDENKLRRNAGWSVAYWATFLRAFDKIYTAEELPIDCDFNTFRRTVWQMKDDF